MTKQEIEQVLALSLEYYKLEIFGTEKQNEPPTQERIEWIYERMNSCISPNVEEAAEITHDEGMELSDDYSHYLATGLTEGWERPIGPKWMMKFAKKRFLAGAEYQRRQDQSLIELAEDHAMLAGMNKMKERMMKDAMECNVIWYDGRLLDFTQEQLDAALDKIGAGVDAKVSVIIVKKEK